jgi:hypothetical protein
MVEARALNKHRGRKGQVERGHAKSRDARMYETRKYVHGENIKARDA